MTYTIDTAVVTAAETYFSTRLGNAAWSAQNAASKLAALQDAATNIGTPLPGVFPTNRMRPCWRLFTNRHCFSAERKTPMPRKSFRNPLRAQEAEVTGIGARRKEAFPVWFYGCWRYTGQAQAFPAAERARGKRWQRKRIFD